MATIQDVAREAEVSVATVSRVLNDSSLVTEKTRTKVTDVINRLNYNPNLLGRNLRRSETRIILVLLPNISNPFFSKIIRGIEDTGHKYGYNIMICNTNSDVKRELSYIELLKSRLADGVIIFASELKKEELVSIVKNYPVVQCCEYMEGLDVSHVSIDSFKASERVMNHLLSLGHKRIGMISCNNNYLSTKRREDGYKEILNDVGIGFKEELLVYGDYGFRSGMKATEGLMSLKNPPTAIFAISDLMAIGAIKAIKGKGLAIPSDMAVAGFDNINFSRMYEPELTTISQPQYDLGTTAMELLLKQIRGDCIHPEDVILEHELLIRRST
ncbi:MAG TPA: LacI family DNA-binding transcriptional regulator [Clostridiaceae bacterium]